jgi:hypothetical protein
MPGGRSAAALGVAPERATRRRRLWPRVLAALLLVIVGLPLLVLGHARFVVSRWRQRVKAERAADLDRVRALRSPVFHGDSRDEDCVPRYEELLASARTWDAEALKGAVELGPAAFVRSSVNARRILHESEAVRRKLHEAVECARCDWGVGKQHDLDALRALGHILILEGHERVSAGDPRGAALAYLDAARFGIDLTKLDSSRLVMGLSPFQKGLHWLGVLVASCDRPAEIDLPTTAQHITELEKQVPTTAETLEPWRLEKLEALLGLRPRDLGVEWAVPYSYVPDCVWVAQALPEVQAAFEDSARYQATLDPKARADMEEAFRNRYCPSPGIPTHFLVYDSAPPIGGMSEHLGRSIAVARIARFACKLEEHKLTSGSYPSADSGLEVPEDPLYSTARLAYESRGNGYRIASTPSEGSGELLERVGR